MRSLALILGIALGVSFPTMPQAQREVSCAPLDRLLAALERSYGERPAVSAVFVSGAELLLVANARGGWTMLLVREGDVGCILADGRGFRILAPTDGEAM